MYQKQKGLGMKGESPSKIYVIETNMVNQSFVDRAAKERGEKNAGAFHNVDEKKGR
jgi:hypothetical protein